MNGKERHRLGGEYVRDTDPRVQNTGRFTAGGKQTDGQLCGKTPRRSEKLLLIQGVEVN